MSYQLIDNETVTEPVTLAEVKAYSRIDADYTSEDAQLGIMMTAARQRLEQYLNIGLARREVTLQWNGYPIDLPLSPNGDIISVSDKDGALATDKYTSTAYQAKKLWVNDVYGGDFNYFYNMNGTVEITSAGGHCHEMYTAVYETGYEELPGALKQALLAEIDYLFKLRGMPVADVISPNSAILANGYSRNLII